MGGRGTEKVAALAGLAEIAELERLARSIRAIPTQKFGAMANFWMGHGAIIEN